MAYNIMTFGVRGVDADALTAGNQQLNGNVGPNELTAANLINANGIPFQQLLLFMGAANNGDLNINVGETAFNLSDMGAGGAVVSLGVTNNNDPIRIRANGLNGTDTVGDLTANVYYDNARGFGLANIRDKNAASSWLNAGDSLTFSTMAINGVNQFIASASFVVNVNGGGSEHVIIDFDGNVVRQDGTSTALDGIDLGLIANGTTVSLNFSAHTISIGATTRAMTDAELSLFQQAGLNQVTIGSLNTSTQGFAIKNLSILATDTLVSGVVVQAPATGGETHGTANDDILIGSTVADVLNAGAGNDVVYGGGGADTINAGDGNDRAEGGDGNDIINGGAGDDIIVGGIGDDTLNGGAGSDAFVFRSLNELSANTDHITDLAGLDTIDFSAMNGLGFIGQNAFSGVAGQVRFEVGAGTTTMQIDADGDGVSDHRVIIDNGQFNLTETAPGSLVFEVRPIVGTAGDDVLIGPDQFDNQILALDGNDTINGGARNDTIIGGLGNDTINGGAGNDTIIYNLGDGADTIDGGADNDVLNIVGIAGLFGNLSVVFNGASITSINGATITNVESINADLSDSPNRSLNYSAASASVVVDLASGTASGFTSIASVNQVTGGNGNDSLTGDGAANFLFGGNGIDTIHGGAGNDGSLSGGVGDDLIFGEDGDDLLNGGTGNDYLDGGVGDDRATYFGLTSGVLVDLNIQGVAQNTGAGGLDTLVSIERVSGTAFNDVLIGTPGDNLFFGNGGNDVLLGGAGTDQFVFNTATSAQTGTLVIDANVADGERLDFSFSTNTFGLPPGLRLADGSALDDGDAIQAGALLGGGVASVVLQNGIVFDWNGDGVADLTVQFTTSDISLVYHAGAAPAPGGGIAAEFVLQATGANDTTGAGLGTAIVGTLGNDTLTGGAGNEWINGLAGNDTLNGGAGNDTIIGDAGNDTINGDEGNDTILGGDGNDVLNGGLGTDVLNAGLGVNQLFGGDGDDVLIAGLNAVNFKAGEVFNGGAGIDTLRADVGVVLPGDFHANYFFNSTLSSIERIDFGTTAPGNNLIGIGTYQLGGGIANNATISGSANRDTLLIITPGVSGTYSLAATSFTFEDWTTGNADGGLNDLVMLFAQQVPGAAYTLIGSAGGELIQGAQGNDTLIGGDGNDALFGLQGVDSYFGGAGDDVVVIGMGIPGYTENYALETFDGGSGNDILAVNGQNVDLSNIDIVLTSFEGIGVGGTLTYSVGTNSFAPPLLGGHVTIDQGILSQLPTNVIVGGSASFAALDGQHLTQQDILTVLMAPGDTIDMSTWTFRNWEAQDHVEIIGSTANDAITGSSQNDRLNGGAGIDQLTGGAGEDQFVFQAGQANGDIVVDFAGNGASAGDGFEFHGYGATAEGATFVQLDATHWQINSADGLIHDVITLANGATVDTSDYIFGP